jgi:hypothetical protein
LSFTRPDRTLYLVAFVGLARTPRKISRALSDAAAVAASAGAELATVSAGRGDVDALDHVGLEAEQRWQELVNEAGTMFGGALDRGDVLAIGLSVKLVSDRVQDAAAGLVFGSAVRETSPALAGVIRDYARQLKAAIDHLDGPDHERAGHLRRAESLDKEGRKLLRTAKADVLRSAGNPVGAVGAVETLRRLELAVMACRRAARAVEQVAVKHA